MNKLTSALLFLTIFPSHVSANSCDIEGYTISFFNGVATSKDAAVEGRKKIESTLVSSNSTVSQLNINCSIMTLTLKVTG